MSELLNGVDFETSYNKLIADTRHPADVKIINIASGQGTLEAGTVISKATADGSFIVCGSDAGTAKYIVADVCESGDTTGSTVPGVVYMSGSFRLDALVVADSYTLTDADVENLELTGNYVK